MLNINKCPFCFRPLGTWQKDPILLPNGCPNEWVSETETILQSDVTKRIYKGFYQICEPEVQEIQDFLKAAEVTAGVAITTWSQLNISGKFQITGKHIKEMRDSVEKILISYGLTKTDYFNYDEDGNLITQFGGGKVDWTDPITEATDLQKFQVKYIHIEDLRHYIQIGFPIIDFPNSMETRFRVLPRNFQITGSWIFTGIQPDTAIIDFSYPNPPWDGWTIDNNDAKNFVITTFDYRFSEQTFKVKYTKGTKTYAQQFSIDGFLYGSDFGGKNIYLYIYSNPSSGWAGWTHEYPSKIKVTTELYKNGIYQSTASYERIGGTYPPDDLYAYYIINEIDGWVTESLTTWKWKWAPFKVEGMSWATFSGYDKHGEPIYDIWGTSLTKVETTLSCWKKVDSIPVYHKDVVLSAKYGGIV